MTSAASSPVWRAVPALAFVQFPWRFLTVVSLAAAITGALALSSVRSRAAQALVVLAAAGVLWWQTHGLIRPSHYFPKQWVFIDDAGWRYGPGAARLAFVEPGYYPATVRRLPDDVIGRWRVTKGAGDVSSRTLLDDRLVLDVSSDRGVELTIASHGFPGWRVLIDGSPAPWQYDPDFGFIVVDVPPGVRTVEAVFGDTRVRAWANRMSALSATLWLGAAVGLAGRHARKRSRAHVANGAVVPPR
jgi:hypothetical protein